MCNGAGEAACGLLSRRPCLSGLRGRYAWRSRARSSRRRTAASSTKWCLLLDLCSWLTGGAVKAVSQRREPVNHLETADDDPGKHGPGS